LAGGQNKPAANPCPPGQPNVLVHSQDISELIM
jgi:hypothetical protein